MSEIHIETLVGDFFFYPLNALPCQGTSASPPGLTLLEGAGPQRFALLFCSLSSFSCEEWGAVRQGAAPPVSLQPH